MLHKCAQSHIVLSYCHYHKPIKSRMFVAPKKPIVVPTNTCKLAVLLIFNFPESVFSPDVLSTLLSNLTGPREILEHHISSLVSQKVEYGVS